MTGRYPYHVGLQDGKQFIPLTAPYGVPLEYDYLPQWLGKAGYSTHALGK